MASGAPELLSTAIIHFERFHEGEERVWNLELSNPKILDPHSCESSCQVPGKDCISCTNLTYFQCHKSNFCVHPSNRCDGHPICPLGEDEEGCSYDQYLEKKIITSHATSECASIMYQNMKTWATPCNQKMECKDGADENCSEDIISNSVLFSAAVTFLIFYMITYFLFFKSCTMCPKSKILKS